MSFKVPLSQINAGLSLTAAQAGCWRIIKLSFSFYVKKKLVESCFVPVLDYVDVLYINASAQSLHTLDHVYRGALRFRAAQYIVFLSSLQYQLAQ